MTPALQRPGPAAVWGAKLRAQWEGPGRDLGGTWEGPSLHHVSGGLDLTRAGSYAVCVRTTLTFSTSRSACSRSFVPSTMAWETQRDRMTLGLGGQAVPQVGGSRPSAAPTPTPSLPSSCRHSHGAGPVPATWPRAKRPGIRQRSSPQAPCAEPGPARGGAGGTSPVPSRLGCGLVGAAKCVPSQVAWVPACR